MTNLTSSGKSKCCYILRLFDTYREVEGILHSVCLALFFDSVIQKTVSLKTLLTTLCLSFLICYMRVTVVFLLGRLLG